MCEITTYKEYFLKNPETNDIKWKSINSIEKFKELLITNILEPIEEETDINLNGCLTLDCILLHLKKLKYDIFSICNLLVKYLFIDIDNLSNFNFNNISDKNDISKIVAAIFVKMEKSKIIKSDTLENLLL